MTNEIPPAYIEEIDKPVDIKYYFFLLRKNLYILLTFFLITVTLASIYAAKRRDMYRAVAQVIVEQPQMPFQPGQPQSFVPMWAMGLPEEYYNTQIELMNSPAVLQPVVEEMRLMDYFGLRSEEAALGKIRGMVHVKRIPDSRLFDVIGVSADPAFAASLANAVARAYVRKNFEDVIYYSKEVLAWLPQSGAATETIAIEDPFGGVRQMTRDQLIESLPAIQADQTLRQLKEKKSFQEADFEILAQKYRGRHPAIQKAAANLKFLNESIQTEKRRIIENLRSQAEGRHQFGQARLVQEAQPPKFPVQVPRFQIVLTAALAELFLSLLIIWLVDYFDDTVRSVEDMEKKGLLLPFLGPVSILKTKKGEEEKSNLVAFHDPKSDIAEAFRYLRVAINFSAPPESLKTLVITSCLPHEGKSFVSQNLAISLALDGNKTLLVDGDLRRPVLHRRFRLGNEAGLTNYLTSRLEIEDVVKETFVENLSGVTSGPVSPNPGEILGSERMKNFLSEAHKKYDRMVIDCPPLTGIGDGFVLGNLVGHVILIISAGKTPLQIVKRIHAQLEKSKVKVIGIILNMVDMDKERYGGYYRHYYGTYDRYYRRANDKEQPTGKAGEEEKS